MSAGIISLTEIFLENISNDQNISQKHFGKLWDRSEFFRKLFFKSPEESEQGLSQEAIEAMGRGMAKGSSMLGGR